jgi:RNA polymerase II subunit A small phosphatase-like protein
MSRLLVILDLDETLVYGAEQTLDRPCDFRAGAGYYVYLRPHLGTFLRDCLDEFDLAVWSSAGGDYVAQLVGRLFADPSRLRFAWSGERCTRRFDERSGAWCSVKDLRKLKRAGFDLARVLVVDDSPEKLQRNFGNHVRVAPYLGAPDDDELPPLFAYLRTLARLDDVRRVEKRSWRLRPRPAP